MRLHRCWTLPSWRPAPRLPPPAAPQPPASPATCVGWGSRASWVGQTGQGRGVGKGVPPGCGMLTPQGLGSGWAERPWPVPHLFSPTLIPTSHLIPSLPGSAPSLQLSTAAEHTSSAPPGPAQHAHTSWCPRAAWLQPHAHIRLHIAPDHGGPNSTRRTHMQPYDPPNEHHTTTRAPDRGGSRVRVPLHRLQGVLRLCRACVRCMHLLQQPAGGQSGGTMEGGHNGRGA